MGVMPLIESAQLLKLRPVTPPKVLHHTLQWNIYVQSALRIKVKSTLRA
jgi:hypothetical protein